MKKLIKFENLKEIKEAKLLSTILLGLPEIESLEFDLDDSTVILNLQENLNENILKYYLNSYSNKILEIKELN